MEENILGEFVSGILEKAGIPTTHESYGALYGVLQTRLGARLLLELLVLLTPEQAAQARQLIADKNSDPKAVLETIATFIPDLPAQLPVICKKMGQELLEDLLPAQPVSSATQG